MVVRGGGSPAKYVASGVPHFVTWKTVASMKYLRLIHQAKLQSYRLAPMYKFGVQIPRNHEQAMQLDAAPNGNKLWLLVVGSRTVLGDQPDQGV